MKTLILRLLGLILLWVLPGCFKKPYESYKNQYKTNAAQQYADKAIDPAQAIKKNIKYMTLPEVRAARIYFEEHNEIELIEKALAHCMKLSDNYQEKSDCLYELATIQLSLGRLEKARELFDQLLREYPGIAAKKEACYRRLLAHYWDCSDAEHDQDMTEKTLKLVQEFMQEFPNSSEYGESLETIQHYCYRLLFEAELLRMNFYLTKYRIVQEPEVLNSAQMRLRYIVEKLIEFQRAFTSEEKDALCEIFDQIKTVTLQEKFTLLNKASRALEKAV
jgi:outer membrane protein assembly factor BamD (BamD/ComL family)